VLPAGLDLVWAAALVLLLVALVAYGRPVERGVVAMVLVGALVLQVSAGGRRPSVRSPARQRWRRGSLATTNKATMRASFRRRWEAGGWKATSPGAGFGRGTAPVSPCAADTERHSTE